MTVSKKTLVQRLLHGEDHIASVRAITLVLENGTTVTLSPKDELGIPTHPDELLAEARRAPARLAFWSYQLARADRSVRDREIELYRLEAQTALTHELYLKKQGERVTNDVVSHRLNFDDAVHTARIQLSEAKGMQAALRATRDALEHRLYVIRKLVTADQEATSSP